MPCNIVKSAVPLSGLFDLEPLRLSYLNSDLRMDEETVYRNSPVHNLPRRMPPTVIAVGGGETDEFLRQSRIYVDACRERGFPVSYLEIGNLDHVLGGRLLPGPAESVGGSPHRADGAVG